MKYSVKPPINCSSHCIGYAQLSGLFCRCVYVPAAFSLGETFTLFIVLGKSVAVVQCHAIHGVVCAVCLKLKKVVVDQIRITQSTQIVWLVSVIVLMFQQHWRLHAGFGEGGEHWLLSLHESYHLWQDGKGRPQDLRLCQGARAHGQTNPFTRWMTMSCVFNRSTFHMQHFCCIIEGQCSMFAIQ